MYANPFDRKFGIEFEFGCRGISSDGPHGYHSDNKRYNFNEILKENGLSDFYVGFDGTEWEIKSPILQGPLGFKRVKKFLAIINDLGGYVTDSDGLHVHHDAPEFVADPRKALNLTENWYKSQPEIAKMVSRLRTQRGWACPQWGPSDISILRERIEAGDPDAVYGFGRKNLNLNALRRHGTIEIRYHEGTLNYEEVLSWVRFGQAFIGKALDEVDPYVEEVSAPELLRNIRVSRNASRFITSKVERYSQSYSY